MVITTDNLHVDSRPRLTDPDPPKLDPSWCYTAVYASDNDAVRSAFPVMYGDSTHGRHEALYVLSFWDMHAYMGSAGWEYACANSRIAGQRCCCAMGGLLSDRGSYETVLHVHPARSIGCAGVTPDA